MSPYATITTIAHRAEFRLPGFVFSDAKINYKYHTDVFPTAAGKVDRWGVIWEDDEACPILWGESAVRRNCEDFVDYLHNWVLIWQGELRARGVEC